MTIQREHIARDVERAVRQLLDKGRIRSGQSIVFGVSTSEVLGQRIGTSGAEQVAEAIYTGIAHARSVVDFQPVFQCCEHLNRALVVDRELAERHSLPIVHAIPMPDAGGAMAAYAFQHMHDACLVEAMQCHAGIDIGDTLIGMHLRPVAVPLRPDVPRIGQAHMTMAWTRPKLIGGERAVYRMADDDETCMN